MQTFDQAIAVQRLGTPDAAGSYCGVVDGAWSIAGRPNGGYLLAMAARAALDTAGPDHPHPVAAAAAYARPPRFGPVELTVEPVRSGRSTSLLQVRMHQDGATCLEALVTCGRLPEPGAGEVWHDGVPAPSLPPEADCVRLSPRGPGFDVPLMGVLSERLDPATAGWASGRPGGASELRAWVRFHDGRAPDPLALLLAVDCLPPATFELGGSGWVPTLQLAAFVRAVPAAGPLLVRQVARHVATSESANPAASRAAVSRSGTVDETCDVWDSTGRLVATGHQLAALRVPRAAPVPG